MTNECCEEFSEDVMAVLTEKTEGEMNRKVMGTYNRCSARGQKEAGLMHFWMSVRGS